MNTTTHLRDTDKTEGIRCNRWHKGFIRLTTNPDDVTCKTCKGVRRASRNAAMSPAGKIAVGDIFYDSWGYSMTIVDFYKVVRLTPKGAEVVGLGQTETSLGYLYGTTVPTETETKRHGVLKFTTYSTGSLYLSGTVHNVYENNPQDSRKVHLSKWSGSPVHFNHCD